MAKVEYPLDTTGTAASNRTQAELHVVVYNSNADYHFIIPNYAPFYADGFQIVQRVGSSRVPLTAGIDYHFGLEYVTATMATGKPIYGAVVIPRVSEDSVYEILPYQTVGGAYVLDEQQTLQMIADIVFNPQALTWEQVQEKPEMFPPVRHPWSFDDMVGQSEVVEALMTISNTIAAKVTPGGDHPFIKGNPHGTSKYDLGLGNVPNYPMADIQMMLSGTNNESFTSPALVYQLLSQLDLLDQSDTLKEMIAHMADMENPHETTKDTVGLGQVSNYPVATDQDISRNLDKDAYITLRGLRLWFALYGGSNQTATKTPIKQGALLQTYCNVHYDRMGVYADGKGGTYESVIKVQDETCGFQTKVPITNPPKGDILQQYCSGPNLMSLIADGYGGATSTVAEINSTKCSGGDYPPKGTIIGTTCEGKTLVRTVADGNGGTTIERVENSSQCVTNTNPVKGTLLRFGCVGFNMMGYYADGDGGEYEGVLTMNSTDCGYVAPTPPPAQTHPPANTVLGTRCDKYSLYYIYANGAGGQYEILKEQNSAQCGYVPPAPTPAPTPPAPTPSPSERIGTLKFETTLTRIYIGDTEVQTTTMTGWTPNKRYVIEIWGSSVAWGQPYERMLDTFNITTNSSGYGQYRLPITETGLVPVGRYFSWMQEKSSGVASNTIERTFLGVRP